jgi:hypothetical protein
MKITAQQIRQIISEELNSILSEAAVGPEDLPEDVKILIEAISEDEIQISYAYEDGSMHKYGYMVIDTVVPMDRDFPCLKAMMVGYVKAEKGYGPLLYDVAMEIATMKAGGLVADRTIVSDDAYNVWDYYDNKRSDVKIIQLDNPEGELTPDFMDDDCLQTKTLEFAKKNNTNWYDEPTSRLYRKQPTTIEALEELGLLILENFEF